MHWSALSLPSVRLRGRKHLRGSEFPGLGLVLDRPLEGAPKVYSDIRGTGSVLSGKHRLRSGNSSLSVRPRAGRMEGVNKGERRPLPSSCDEDFRDDDEKEGLRLFLSVRKISVNMTVFFSACLGFGRELLLETAPTSDWPRE